jgi:hypothetical protein
MGQKRELNGEGPCGVPAETREPGPSSFQRSASSFKGSHI